MEEKVFESILKSQREQTYQKKVCLQKIYEVVQDVRQSPDERIDKVKEVCELSGVYVERENR